MGMWHYLSLWGLVQSIVSMDLRFAMAERSRSIGAAQTLFWAVVLLSLGTSACIGSPPTARTAEVSRVIPSVQATKQAASVDSTQSAVRPTKTAWPSEPEPSRLDDWPSLPDAPTPGIITWFYTSPDGLWLAEVRYESLNAEAHIQLIVRSADGSISWLIIDKTEPLDLGQRLPGIVHWSRTGPFLYFANSSVPDGCPLFPILHDLYRLDLITGQISEILSPDKWAWAVALSPDEKSLAYLTSGQQHYAGGKLILRNLETGAEQMVALPESAETWGLVWSPDSMHLAYTQSTSEANCKPSAFSIGTLDTQTLRQTVLVQDDPRLLETVQWPEASRILLTDRDPLFLRDSQLWWLDIESGMITPALLPTPTSESTRTSSTPIVGRGHLLRPCPLLKRRRFGS